ncbi:MAG TPA: hypothetical protein VES66_10155 [Terriglobales bacterium]|nr:hypothetical protein [Terriglobales bacterium]
MSHAAIDQEIALYLKEILQALFSEMDVFVSSDPEDLPSGTAWVETVLHNLREARKICILATTRGLDRKWVWFEAGSGWREGGFVPLALGKVRKHLLPPPYSHYQGHNIDEEEDCRKFLRSLEADFGVMQGTPDYGDIQRNLIRLDVRSEERLAATQNPFLAELDAEADRLLAQLGAWEQEAVRLVLVQGELTDRQAMAQLQSKTLLQESVGSVFISIAERTNFVRRVWPVGQTEHVTGYQGPYQISPNYKDSLVRIFERQKLLRQSKKT